MISFVLVMLCVSSVALILALGRIATLTLVGLGVLVVATVVLRVVSVSCHGPCTGMLLLVAAESSQRALRGNMVGKVVRHVDCHIAGLDRSHHSSAADVAADADAAGSRLGRSNLVLTSWRAHILLSIYAGSSKLENEDKKQIGKPRTM